MAENLSLDRQISDIICRFCRTVKRRNQKGLYDLTRSGEDVVCHLLNLAFDWNLINLNREYPNL